LFLFWKKSITFNPQNGIPPANGHLQTTANQSQFSLPLESLLLKEEALPLRGFLPPPLNSGIFHPPVGKTCPKKVFSKNSLEPFYPLTEFQQPNVGISS